MARNRRLERSWPVDRDRPGLSAVSLALPRHEQPFAGAPGPQYRNDDGVSRIPSLGGRRDLSQSGVDAGLRAERRARYRRVPERRGAEVEFSDAALQHGTDVSAADVRAR